MSGRLTLCVDRSSGRVVEARDAGGNGTVMPFFEGSQPAQATRQALISATSSRSTSRRRAPWSRRSTRMDCLPCVSKVTLESGEILNLTDFQVIDEAAFNKLSDEVFSRTEKIRALALLYCHLASMNSWSLLPSGESKAPEA